MFGVRLKSDFWLLAGIISVLLGTWGLAEILLALLDAGIALHTSICACGSGANAIAAVGMDDAETCCAACKTEAKELTPEAWVSKFLPTMLSCLLERPVLSRPRGCDDFQEPDGFIERSLFRTCRRVVHLPFDTVQRDINLLPVAARCRFTCRCVLHRATCLRARSPALHGTYAA